MFNDTQPIFKAVKNSDLSYVQTHPEELCLQDSHEMTILHCAAFHGEYEIMQWLLDHAVFVDVDVKDKFGTTPLHHAALAGHLNMVKLLVTAKASLLKRDVHGASILHYAAESGVLEVTEWLFRLNLPLALEDNDGATPLHYAAENNHLSIIYWLISYGKLNKDQLDKYGNSILHCAASEGHSRVLKELSPYYSMAFNVTGLSFLHVAAQKGHVHCIKGLLERTPSLLYQKDLLHRTIVHHASREGHLNILRYLSNRFPSQFFYIQKDFLGRIPLHYASLHGNLKVVQCLIAIHPKSVFSEDFAEKTALDYATEHEHESIVKLLQLTIVNHFCKFRDVTPETKQDSPNQLKRSYARFFERENERAKPTKTICVSKDPFSP